MSRLDELLEQHFDAALSEEAARELELLLARDAQARDQFWKSAEWHAQLRMVAVRRTEPNRADSRRPFAPVDDAEMARQHSTRSPAVPALFKRVVPAAFRHYRGLSWLAAAVVVGVALGVMSLMFLPKPRNQAGQNDVAELPSSGEPENAFAARLARTHEAVWERGTRNEERGTRIEGGVDRDPQTLAANADLFIGDRIYLKSGRAEIYFAKGTISVLEGPAVLSIEGNNHCALNLGKLAARVETQRAKGFAVRTPTATITDLGTEFGVEVNQSGAVHAHVFRGEIEIAQTAAAGGGSVSEPPARLGAGQSAVVRGGKVTVQPADDHAFATFANTRLPEPRAADGSILAYHESFDAFTVGPIGGQRGWTATVGQPQIALGDRVVAGSSASTPGMARNLSLFSITPRTTKLTFQGRMRMRSQFGNRAAFVDRTGKVIIGFGAGYGGYNFVVVNDSDHKLFSGNAPGGNALSPTSHAWYDVMFAVDFNGDRGATGTFAVKKDGQARYTTLASGLNLKLHPQYEDPIQWTGLLLAMRSASDQQDDIHLSCVTAEPATASRATTESPPLRGSN